MDDFGKSEQKGRNYLKKVLQNCNFKFDLFFAETRYTKNDAILFRKNELGDVYQVDIIEIKVRREEYSKFDQYLELDKIKALHKSMDIYNPILIVRCVYFVFFENSDFYYVYDVTNINKENFTVKKMNKKSYFCGGDNDNKVFKKIFELTIPDDGSKFYFKKPTLSKNN